MTFVDKKKTKQNKTKQKWSRKVIGTSPFVKSSRIFENILFLDKLVRIQ